MRAARLIVANGGSTLLQAIACGSACIAVPIAKDQARAHPALCRRRRGSGRGTGRCAHPAAPRTGCCTMSRSAPRLRQRAARLGLADGVEIAAAGAASAPRADARCGNRA